MMKYYAIAALLAGASADPSVKDKFAEGSELRESLKVYGNMAPAMTPINEKGDLDFSNLEKLAARFQEWGIKNVLVSGTAGESVSFTYEERLLIVEEWLTIHKKYDLNIYVHVGMNSLQETADLARRVTQFKEVKGIVS